MRFIYSLLCMFVITAFFAWNAQASDLSGAQAKDLTFSTLDDSSLKFMTTFCEKEAGTFTIPNIKVCNKILDPAKVTQDIFDFCKETASARGLFLTGFTTCIQNFAGRDYPYSYVTACKNVREKTNAGIPVSSPKMCLDYLANTASKFNGDAFELCLKANENHLKKSKGCLNAIRDREVDTQKLERECFKNGKPTAETEDCIEKLTDSMPAVTNCAKTSRPAGEQSSATVTPGTR